MDIKTLLKPAAFEYPIIELKKGKLLSRRKTRKFILKQLEPLLVDCYPQLLIHNYRRFFFSNYPLKKSLQRSFSIIMRQWHDIGPNEQKMIAILLAEGGGACVEGFHDRVLFVVHTWQSTFRIEYILLQLRQHIIEVAAGKINQDVHMQNRFFVVGAAEGLGVKGNSDDKYQGGIANRVVLKRLNIAFNNSYHPIGIFNYVIQQIRFHAPRQYLGQAMTQENIETYQLWAKELATFLHIWELNLDSLLITHEEKPSHYVVHDFNWPYIYYEIYKTLVADYFNIPEVAEAFLNALFNPESELELNGVIYFAALETIIIPPTNQTFADYLTILYQLCLSKEKKGWLLQNIINHFVACEFLCNLLKNNEAWSKEALQHLSSYFHHEHLIYPVIDQFMLEPKTLARALLFYKSCDIRLFKIAKKYIYGRLLTIDFLAEGQKKLIHIVYLLNNKDLTETLPLSHDFLELAQKNPTLMTAIFSDLPMHSYLQNIIAQTPQEHRILLFEAFLKLSTVEASLFLTRVFESNETWSKTALEELATIFNHQHLILPTVRNTILNTDILARSLSFYKKISPGFLVIAKENIKSLILSKYKYYLDCDKLIIIANLIAHKTIHQYAPELDDLFIQFKASTLENIRSVAFNHPDRLPTVFEAISLLSDDEQFEILTKKDENGFDLLSIVSNHRANLIAPVVYVLPKLCEKVQFTLIKYCLLMAAVLTEPEAVSNLLQLINKWPTHLGRNLFNQQYKYYDRQSHYFYICNIFHIAILRQPKVLSLLLNAVINFTNPHQWIFFHTKNNSIYNALFLALTNNPQAVPALLDFIEYLPKDIQLAIFESTNEQHLNVVLLALFFAPLYLPQLLKLMSTFPLQRQIDIIWQANTEGDYIISHAPCIPAVLREYMSAIYLMSNLSKQPIPRLFLGNINWAFSLLFQFAPKFLKMNIDIVIKVIQYHPQALLYASETLKSNQKLNEIGQTSGEKARHKAGQLYKETEEYQKAAILSKLEQYIYVHQLKLEQEKPTSSRYSLFHDQNNHNTLRNKINAAIKLIRQISSGAEETFHESEVQAMQQGSLKKIIASCLPEMLNPNTFEFELVHQLAQP